MLSYEESQVETKTISIKSKQDEICSLTKELRSHYYQGKFFVDPDKTFLNLLEKIIKFFEKDDLPCEIQENEYNCKQYQAKYDQAVQLIETLADEKDKLSKALKFSKIHPIMHSAKRQDEDYDEHLSNLSDINLTPNSTNSNEQFHHHDQVSEFSQENNDTRTVSLVDYEKIRFEYITTFGQKKALEQQCMDLLAINDKYNILKIDHEELVDLSERQSEKIKQMEKDSLCSHQQMEKYTKDKDSLIVTISALRERINLCESEKAEIKIKNAHHLSKFQYLEKEIAKLTKKNHTLTNNVKDLIDKMHNEGDRQRLIQQRYEEQIEELENKIIALETEKKKITKDSMTTFVESTAKKMNNISLCYNPNHNKIEIKYDNEIIGEVSNNDQKELNTEKTKGIFNSQLKSPFNMKKEATICRFRQLTCYDKYNQNSRSNTKQCSPSRNQMNLRKLFSNNNFSISSKKSYESNSIFEDKENKNNLNLNMISLKSIGQKNQNINIEERNVACFNTEANISNCILNANLTKEALIFTGKPSTGKNDKISQPTAIMKPLVICSKESFSVIDNEEEDSKEEMNVEGFVMEFIPKEENIALPKSRIILPEIIEESDREHSVILSYGKRLNEANPSNKKSKDEAKLTPYRHEDKEDIQIRKRGVCASCVIF